MKHIHSAKESRLTSGVLMLICVVALSAGGWTKGGTTRQESAVRVENRTQSFQVVSTEQVGTDYVLRLKNGYGKAINGYSLGVGSGRIDTELTTGGRFVAPGETAEARVPVSSVERASKDSPSQPPITILAVMFEDKTSDGNPAAVAVLEHRRMGMKLQLERIIPLLHAALNSAEPVTPETLAKLKSRISSLPESADALPAVASGALHGTKELVMMEIQMVERDVEPGKISYRDALIQLKEKLVKRLARL